MPIDSNISKVPHVGIISVARRMEGGAEVVLKNLLISYPFPQKLTLIAPKDCELDSVARNTGANWIELSTAKDNFLCNFNGIRRALPKLKKLDLIHGWTRRTFDLAAYSAFILNSKCTTTLHDNVNAFFIGSRRRLLMRLALSEIESVVCVSEHLRLSLRNTPFFSKSKVIQNGVADFSNEITKCDIGRKIQIGFMGMHHPQKGFKAIQTWIPTILTTFPNTSFELFGELHSMWEKPLELLQTKFPGKINFHGRAPISKIFSIINVLIQNSYPFVETFGMVLGEAACAGIPVVTSDHGAESEVVVSGETGYIFPASDPNAGLERVIHLCKNPELRARMGKNARNHYEKSLQASEMSHQYLKLWSGQTA